MRIRMHASDPLPFSCCLQPYLHRRPQRLYLDHELSLGFKKKRVFLPQSDASLSMSVTTLFLKGFFNNSTDNAKFLKFVALFKVDQYLGTLIN